MSSRNPPLKIRVLVQGTSRVAYVILLDGDLADLTTRQWWVGKTGIPFSRETRRKPCGKIETTLSHLTTILDRRCPPGHEYSAVDFTSLVSKARRETLDIDLRFRMAPGNLDRPKRCSQCGAAARAECFCTFCNLDFCADCDDRHECQ